MTCVAAIAAVASLAQVPQTIADNQIKMNIYARFIPDPDLHYSDIDVEISRGVVTLTGTVAAHAGRERAIAIAKSIQGVKAVADNLRTAEQAPPRPIIHDGIIKAHLYVQLLGDQAVGSADISVAVDDGIVTLQGTVRSEAERTRAMGLATATPGVTGVTNDLTIATARD